MSIHATSWPFSGLQAPSFGEAWQRPLWTAAAVADGTTGWHMRTKNQAQSALKALYTWQELLEQGSLCKFKDEGAQSQARLRLTALIRRLRANHSRSVFNDKWVVELDLHQVIVRVGVQRADPASRSYQTYAIKMPILEDGRFHPAFTWSTLKID